MKAAEQPKIKVLLVDDHPFVLEGVKSYLLKQPGFKLVGEACNGQEAVEKTLALAPDVVVMDITMPSVNGLEATRRLRELSPKTKVLILTVHEKREFVSEIIQSGARGYVRKNTSPAELVRAIECIHRGEAFFAPEVAQAFFDNYVLTEGRMEKSGAQRLSEREREVLILIAEGLANKEIADRLNVSVRTAEKHRQSVMDKLGVHKATELVKFAITHGLVNLDSSDQTPPTERDE
jgi:DNA-binding NarL/FixJ family response regulator